MRNGRFSKNDLAWLLSLSLCGCLGLFGLSTFAGPTDSPGRTMATQSERDRSPIALALSANGGRILTANQTGDSVSWIDTKSGQILQELATGDRPAGVALSRDGKRGVVTHWYGYDLAILAIDGDRLKLSSRVEVGPEPRGVTLSPDGSTAFVAVGASNEVVKVDLDHANVTGRLIVGREPRDIAITPDGSLLVTSNARSRDLSVIDTKAWKVTRSLPTEGDNQRQIAISPDGKTAYVANMFNRGFATTKNNIDLGWVLGQRITRVDLDGSNSYQTLSLDVRGKAASDAHGATISPDGRFVAVSCGGTHEVMIFRTDLRRLPWRSNGSRDFIAPELLKDDGRFHRVRVGGRPTEMLFSPDSRTLYVANYLDNSIQLVDAEAAKLTQTIKLGSAASPSLARRGETLFHDAERSFNQWYSCNTCHSDGHTNGLDFDTMNDGWQDLNVLHQYSRKKAPTLRRVIHTAPWTWHGWQKSLEQATIESFTKSMQGQRPTEEEAKAVVAYLATLEFPRNPHRGKDDSISPQAQRGHEVFHSAKAACVTCHGGAELTDGKIHQTGLEEPSDVYRGYNPPSLRGVYDKDPYLHDGRAKTLKDALTGGHNPEEVSGIGALSESEVDDLIAYLKTL